MEERWLNICLLKHFRMGKLNSQIEINGQEILEEY